jgi:signal transduction histidine kinase
LNLVLLVVGFVLHWTLTESVVAVALVNLTYLAACLLHDYLRLPSPPHKSDVTNNFYFLILTGIIVAVGNSYHSRLRLREFSLRFELGESRRGLEEAHKKLVELDETKTRFFANISHELRTPLTLLLAPLDAIRAEKWPALDPETRDWLQTMQANGFRLLRLINELLDLVKLESGNMRVKLEPLSLGEFLHGLVSSIQGAARDKHLRAQAKIDPGLSTILADRDKLEKILLNLLFNAIKFTPAGGDVLLEASSRESTLVLKVQDTGMGIKKEELPFIFKRFWQADTSSSRKYQGTGIGLALVKELVGVQSGSVSVESKVGVGTTMTVTLPLLLPGAETSPPSPSPSPTAPAAGSLPAVAISAEPVPPEVEEKWMTELYRRAELFPSMTQVSEAVRPAQDFSRASRQLPTLLIADDEPDMLRFLKSQLAGRYRIIEAVDGRQALENARQFLPDVLLVDMMMPEIDGLQVCRELQAQTSTQNIPIILLTARADEETKLTALTAGASDFLTKPFSTTELHVRVKNLVDGHLSQRKLARQNQVLEATIEQLKETETQLVQSEKMASLGRLSAGIIHEINNPLNYAKTGLFTLRRQGQALPEEKRAVFNDILKDIEEGVDRVKTIVSDLRTFTHPNPRDLGDVNLLKLTQSALRFMGADFATGVKMEMDVPAEFEVRGNVNKLLQVLINLLQNAFDALKRKVFTDSQPTITIQARVVNGKPSLSVRDNGQGIKPEVMDKIFEPFFTTKDVGEGMGLGLSICYRVMEECGGRIYAKSAPGEFCEFILEFSDPGRADPA